MNDIFRKVDKFSVFHDSETKITTICAGDIALEFSDESARNLAAIIFQFTRKEAKQ